MLASLGVTAERLRQAHERSFVDPFEPGSGWKQVSPAFQLVLERANLEAVLLTDAEVTSEHILARRHQALSVEIDALAAQLEQLVATAAPELVARFGIGHDSAAALLVAAGDNPDRLTSEAAFSMLCGASPIPASSGKTIRHRLNRGGDRQANAALHRIVIVRLRCAPANPRLHDQTPGPRQDQEEIIRCLKRYVAREVFARALPDAP